MAHFDSVIIGGGAAGLFCAGVAGQLGLKVLVIDHSDRVAEKVRISGGGRCNFTNQNTTHQQFISDNPRFARSALAGYTPQDFLSLMHSHGIRHHEKHKGQLFCDRSAQDIIQMLLQECAKGQVSRWQPCAVAAIRYASSPVSESSQCYELDTTRGTVLCKTLVIATGGLSMPAIGATDFGYQVAKQFGIPLVPTRPALVPLTFNPALWQPFAELSGLSLPVEISTGTRRQSISFVEDLLFTHKGLSGPGVLQISSYWLEGTALRINLTPGVALAQALAQAKANSKKRISNVMTSYLPARLAELWAAQGGSHGHDWNRAVNEVPDKSLTGLAQSLMNWEVYPVGTEGYRKAEVTAGGIDTRSLSSQTMQSSQPGLFFIGEVVDVTGWLGGYNFQWAWSSAFACAKGLKASTESD